MNRPQQPQDIFPIADVQSASDDRELAIDDVGIRGLRYPLLFADADDPPQPTIAVCNVYVRLPAERKGTHMSRLVALLEARTAAGEPPLTVRNLRNLLEALVVLLDAPGGRIELAFPFFIRKSAPVSGVASLLDYEARLVGELAGGVYRQTVAIAVPVTSLCPCSKEISEYGAHNQRSLITITAREQEPVSLTEIIRIAEAEASCELYGILKRADEKYVTERAYNNPRFVEDLVRGVAARLSEDSRFDGFSVEAENYESIHNHSAYARISRGL
ncbi:MAG TPA: GTP cyclohydrolase FolE2 [Casimicrobiaceae bacterium]|nr:GTP cyclohydrolase FolE2 [Casimicrobiaceae bacterium]